MGVAIIIPNLDFSSKNLGQVNFDQNVPIRGLSISEGSRVGNDIQMEATFLPSNTTQTGLTWSIQSGSTYASINSSTGVVTVLQGASSSSVVVKATSTANSSITATCTLSVTYQKVVKRIQYIATNGYNYVDTGVTPALGFAAEVTYKLRNSSFTGTTFLMGEIAYKSTSSNYAGIYDIAALKNHGTSNAYSNQCHGYNTDNYVTGTNSASKFTIKIGDFGYEATSGGSVVGSADWTSRSYSTTYGITRGHGHFYLCNCNVNFVPTSDTSGTPTGPQNNVDLVNIYDFKLFNGSTELLHLQPALVDGVPMFVDDENNEYSINGTSDIKYLEDADGTEATYSHQ